jgi:hypothetical protein
MDVEKNLNDLSINLILIHGYTCLTVFAIFSRFRSKNLIYVDILYWLKGQAIKKQHWELLL